METREINENVDLSVIHLMIRSILPYDNVLAQKIAKEKDIDFTGVVIDLLKTMMSLGAYPGQGKGKYIRKAIEEIGIDKFLKEFQTWKLTSEGLIPLSVLLPELLQDKRKELVTFLSSSCPRTVNMDDIVDAVSDIKIEIIKAFNANNEINTLSDEELVAKIQQISVGMPRITSGFKKDLYNRYLISEIVDSFIKRRKDLRDRLMSQIFSDQCTSYRCERIIKKVVKILSESEHYIYAAQIAKEGDLRELEIELANSAYQKAVGRRQFNEAASLCVDHNIGDILGAARLELQRLDENNDFRDVLTWARKFKLSFLPKNTINWLIANCSVEDIDFLIFNDPKNAKRVIKSRLIQDGILDYYQSEDGFFSDDETIADIGEAVEFRNVVWVYEMLEKLEWLNRQFCIQKIAENVISAWINKDNIPIRYIQSVINEYLPDKKLGDYESMAKEIALKNAGEDKWYKFVQICGDWNFTELLDEFRQCKRLLPGDSTLNALFRGW